MTNGAREALQAFNSGEEADLIKEAHEARLKFVHSIHTLLAIALNNNVEEYVAMSDAFDAGATTFDFEHYVISSDWDERRARKGLKYQPTVLFMLKNKDDVRPIYQMSTTEEMLIAVPTQEGFDANDEATIEDIDLSTTAYVYWKTKDGLQHCFEVSEDGVRIADSQDEEEGLDAFLNNIDMRSFTALSTGAALIARLRQDLKNLELVPHFTVTIDVSGDDVTPEK